MVDKRCTCGGRLYSGDKGEVICEFCGLIEPGNSNGDDGEILSYVG